MEIFPYELPLVWHRAKRISQFGRRHGHKGNNKKLFNLAMPASRRSNTAPYKEVLSGSKAQRTMVNNNNLRVVLLQLRTILGLPDIPPFPARMKGTFTKTEVFIGARSVYGPEDSRCHELGKIVFISEDGSRRYLSYSDNDGIPLEYLEDNRDVLKCLERHRELVGSSGHKSKTAPDVQDSTGGSITAPAVASTSTPSRNASKTMRKGTTSVSMSTAPTTPNPDTLTRRPIPNIDRLYPIIVDSDDDWEQTENEDLLVLTDTKPNSNSDDLIPASDATMFTDNDIAFADEEEAAKGKGKLKSDDGQVDRRSAPESDVAFVAVVLVWYQDSMPPKRINFPVLKDDSGFINLNAMKSELGELGIEIGHHVERCIASDNGPRWARIKWGTLFFVCRDYPIGLKSSNVVHIQDWEDYKLHTFANLL
ncbi:hypothetical protein V5O48_003631 [Marasmius crinis-equi]|uniref:Uncharacterized protein n=1 Tax=Marasmius crinis-equi TaxID=585013 RepID=A0ABR3FTB8_9AGAR